ncbi:MAG: hypothetical protein LBI12_08045 [Treponema sp.]|jgi:hypothetical protein|nr:hypothetical protein [Treponema sp.]
MKHLSFLSFLAAWFLCGATVFAESPAPAFTWSLFTSGSWEENLPVGGTLYNRADFKLNLLQPGLTLRGQILDRRKLNFELEPPWGEPGKVFTNLTAGLYHKPTGSRLLYGVLDEWGLSARIRNPWIRSPPYSENHKPLMADLKTAASSTKNDEAYLYLSSPKLNVSPNVKLRSFISAQTEIENFTPALAGGIDFSFPKKTGLLMEFFHTQAVLPPANSKSWFSYPPPLPEREFKLYAAGFLFHNALVSVSSDWAMSETFAWGTDIYGNFGITITPALPFGVRKRPLSVSIAADGAGERFIYRDGASHGEGFRGAAKIEWKGERNSLLRLNTVLRGPGIGDDFNRSSTGFYYRFPALKKGVDANFIRLTRISLTLDRNAENLDKINDRISGYIGFSFNLQKIGIKTPLGATISGSMRGLASSENNPSPYPVPYFSGEFFQPGEFWHFNSAGINCEFTWSPAVFQFKTRVGYTNNVKNDENDIKWDYSFSTAMRLKNARLSFKAASDDFPEKWDWTISWRYEKR